jgi:hypothetical protein
VQAALLPFLRDSLHLSGCLYPSVRPDAVRDAVKIRSVAPRYETTTEVGQKLLYNTEHDDTLSIT